jgi:hypothetical protein
MAEQYRKCLVCGYEGTMKTWQANSMALILLDLVLLCVYIIPGLIAIAWNWNKHKCPKCNSINKSIRV